MRQHYPDIKNNPVFRELARVLNDHAQISSQIGRPTGGQRAEVVDIDDPLERGRVRVIFDALNQEKIPAIEGAGQEYSGPRQGKSQISHWIDCCPAFRGKQPPSLVGKRVLVNTTDGELHYSILGDVLQDPELLVSDAAEKLKTPNSSPMVRLPPYPAGELPPPCAENIGCMVVELDGPMGCDWVCVCLKRNGKYIWVRHSDLAHFHAGGNDVTSQVDSSGNRPSPGQVAATFDHVGVTSAGEMPKYSSYFTGPAGNPWGKDCGWSSPPMSPEIKPLEFKTGPLFDQTVALEYARNSGFLNSIAGSFIPQSFPSISAAVETVPGVNFAGKALAIAQKALSYSEIVNRVVSNPLAFVQDTSLATFSSFIPAPTQSVLSGISNPQGIINSVYKSVSAALGK